jgi:hypothetical protein
MAQLVDLDKRQNHHHVHHRGVKLEADIGRTQVEDAAEDALWRKLCHSYTCRALPS